MSRKDTIKTLYTPQAPKLAAANSPPAETPERPKPTPAKPIRSMGLVLERAGEESRALQKALAAGASVVELDPGLVDPSIVRDRLDHVDEAKLQELERSIETHGQEVPILVRPHPAEKGRYQAAYGHRRLAVLARLGRPVRAVVRAMSDEELVIAQGVENAARLDLSFIERAVFATDLEARGFSRALIMDALSTDKTELSKMLSVTHAIPRDLIRAIGPAPKAGRRRWLDLAEMLSEPRRLRQAEALIGSENFQTPDTDARFEQVLAAAAGKPKKSARPAVWKDSSGRAIARISTDDKAVTIAISQKAEPEFGAYVLQQLEALHQAFKARQRGED